MVDRACPPQPGPPETRGGIQARVRFADVTRCGQTLGPGQRAVHLLARPQDVPGAHPAAFDAQRHVGLQPDGLTCARGVGRVTISARQRPRRRGPAVIKHRLADQLYLDLTVDGCRGAHQDMIRVIVGRGSGVRGDRVFAMRRPHGRARRAPRANRPACSTPSTRCSSPARRRGRRDVDAERTQPEIPRLAVEQRPEHAGRVEPRDAQPSDAPVRRDQRTRMAVREERIVLDRGKRRRHRRTLPAASRGHAHDPISPLVPHSPIQGSARHRSSMARSAAAGVGRTRSLATETSRRGARDRPRDRSASGQATHDRSGGRSRHTRALAGADCFGSD